MSSSTLGNLLVAYVNEKMNEKSFDECGDIHLMKMLVSMSGDLTQEKCVEMCRLWTIREPMMGMTYLMNGCGESGVNAVERIGDGGVKREFTEVHSWHKFFKPSRIKETWRKSDFMSAGNCLYGYFSGHHQDYYGMVKVRIQLEMYLCGVSSFGSGSLVRLCFHALGKEMPEGPHNEFYRMSPEVNKCFEALEKKFGVTNTKEFNEMFKSNYNAGEISYIVSAHLKPFLS